MNHLSRIGLLTLVAMLPFLPSARAQTTSGVGIGTTAPDASAALEIASSDKGFLLPRLTQVQRAAIVAPAVGLVVYQTDGAQPGFWYYQASGGWTFLSSMGPAGSNATVAAGAGLSGSVSGGVTTVRLGGSPLTTATDVPLNNQSLTFSGTGNVGVGLTVPQHRLDVQAQPRSGPHPTGLPFYVTGDVGPASDGVEFRHSNGTQGIGFGFNSIYAAGSNASQDLNLMPKGNGKVGIGTIAPTQKLDVLGTTRTTGLQLTGGTLGVGRVLTSDASGNASWQPPVDASPTNELQTLSKSGSTVTLSNGGGSFTDTDTDAQQLSISGSTISLTNGGAVTLPALFDNLGNHTATRNLDLATSQLVGNGGARGVSISSGGNVGIGTTAPANLLDVQAGTRSGAHPTNLPLYVTTTSSEAASGVEFRHSNGTQGIGFGFNSIYAAGSTINQDLNLMPKGNGGVGIGTTTPQASAQLELASTTKGFLPPRLTAAQRDAIAAPATGLVHRPRRG